MHGKPTPAHGPYIVTTRRPVDAVDAGHPDAPRNGWPVSRRAVATLEEARPVLLEGPAWDESIDTAAYIAFRKQVIALPESGGTVGPLPDGTVIEVEPVTWIELQMRAPNPAHDWWGAGDRILAAYNAAQAEGLMT